jgi:NADH:ubiquinone oxidoreductase subunit 3 (subunit A)
MPAEGYAVNWTAIVLAVGVGFFGMAAMFAANLALAPRRRTAAKDIPYESGIPPTPYKWSQLNVRYYVFAILFLVFDVEAVFLFPWAVVFLKDVPAAVFYEMLIFIAVLLLGVGYAWRKGVLQWR